MSTMSGETFELPWSPDLDPTFTLAPPQRSATVVPLRPVDALRPHVDLEVVIPAYNEEKRLPATLEATLSYLEKQDYTSAVVVVDNGSVDYTSEIVDALAHPTVPLHVVGCAHPGKGAAVRRGFLTGSSTWVGFQDADGSTPVETLDRVVPLLKDGVACVMASRHIKGAELAVEQRGFRRLGGTAFRALAHTVVRGIEDSQCGFKFFQGDAVRPIVASSTISGFAFDLELLARLQLAQQPLVELPVVWTDADGSTFSALRHGPRAAADVLRLSRSLKKVHN